MLDLKPRSYAIELCHFKFFDMISDLKFIRLGNNCVTLHIA